MNLPTSTGYTDPWPEILHLVTQKVTYKGAPVAGPPETVKGFVNWMMQQMPAVVGSGDPETKANMFLSWLRSEQRYEADTATRMAAQAAVQTAPPNPISSQTVPQQAQVMAPPQPQAVAAAPAAPAAEAPEGGPGMKCPECGTDVSGVRGFKRHVTMTHKVDWPAFCTKYGLDQKTALPGTAPAAVAAAPVAPPPPPQAQPVPPMFQASGPAAPFMAPAPPPMPASMPTPPATVQGAPTVPTMGVAPPAQPIPANPGPMVAFNPAAPAAAPVISPGLPGQQQVPFQYPQQPQAVIPQAAPAPTPAPAAAPPQAINFAGPSRDDLAKMLGGAVDLIVVRLLDAATINLQGRVDVNQMAAVAEAKAKAEMKVVDLAQASYGVGKQAAQRHFAELLTAAPGCYLLLNGYEPILPAGYLDILAARVTKFHIVTDSGRQTTTIF